MRMSMRIIYQPHPWMRIWMRILKQCGLSADADANTRYTSRKHLTSSDRHNTSQTSTSHGASMPLPVVTKRRTFSKVILEYKFFTSLFPHDMIQYLSSLLWNTMQKSIGVAWIVGIFIRKFRDFNYIWSMRWYVHCMLDYLLLVWLSSGERKF